MNINPNLYFLKLGGSLITEKATPSTTKPDTISRIMDEISISLLNNPEIKLLIGHGSGSFGHMAAHKYGTQHGVSSSIEWKGFNEVWFQANLLNQIIVEALHQRNIPAIVFPPSSGIIASSKIISSWDIRPIQLALNAGIIPVVYGDVAFDLQLGGTIVSTEEVFAYLAKELLPKKILIAGIEPGVWKDYPKCTQVELEITPASLKEIENSLMGSTAPDVTGGMASKVKEMLTLTENSPGLEINIFSGEIPGSIHQVLTGANIGTRLYTPTPDI